MTFNEWYNGWVGHEIPKYTFPDGKTIDFSDKKLIHKYFDKYQDKVLSYQETIEKMNRREEP